MKITTAKFVTSAPSLKECPVLNLPEFALIGRSNVGKSSFINTIVNQKGLAKTSNKPGKTRLINLFNIGEKFIIADLPGYGYAQVSKKMQDDWQKNLENYLLNRDNLVCLIQFIDARHPVQKNDLLMAEWINHHQLPYMVLATKVDNVSRSQVKNITNYIAKELKTEVLPFSKMNNYYNKDILNAIEKIIDSSK